MGTGWLAAALLIPALPGDAWTPVYSGVVAIVAAGSALALAVRERLSPGLGRPPLGLGALIAAALFPLALGAFTVAEPGAMAALTVAIIGFVSRSRRVWTAATVALVLYGVHFYYDLDWGLAAKGGSMIGAGVVWLGVALLARSYAAARPAGPRPAKSAWGRALVGVGTVVAVSFVSLAVGVEEAELARSEVVYVELAPVDPRSLVQGDFMRLRYRLARDLPAGDGTTVIQLDERRVATWARHDDSGSLTDDERRLLYFATPAGPAFTSRAYLFQEGTAEVYERARYGVVALSPRGRAALVGLADRDLQRLGPPHPRF